MRWPASGGRRPSGRLLLCSHHCNHRCSHCSCQCNHHNGQNSHYHIHCSPWHILRHRWSSLQVNYEVAVCNFPCNEILRAVGHFAIWGIYLLLNSIFSCFWFYKHVFAKVWDGKCYEYTCWRLEVCPESVSVGKQRQICVVKVKVCPRKVKACPLNQLVDLFVSLSHLSLISY